MSIDATELAHMKAIAEAATLYWHLRCGDLAYVTKNHTDTFDPPTVLGLLAELERLRWSYADAIAEVEQSAAEVDELRALLAQPEDRDATLQVDAHEAHIVRGSE